MGLFGFGKKDKVLDLSDRYKRKVAEAEQAKKAQASSSGSAGNGPFSFFDSPAVTGESTESETMDIGSMEERKRRLAKRITEMTGKMEDLGNQIYHLQQRLEVLERKLDVNRFS